MWTALVPDLLGRTHETLHDVLPGMSPAELAWRPGPGTNPIGWIAWHALRVEDDHLADLAGRPQVWVDGGWAERFALPYPVEAIGYGHTDEEVAAFSAHDADLLLGYADAVHARALEIVEGFADDDPERIVDERWDPPVTLAVRLVSLVNDVTQHVGQIGYLAGWVARRV